MAKKSTETIARIIVLLIVLMIIFQAYPPLLQDILDLFKTKPYFKEISVEPKFVTIGQDFKVFYKIKNPTKNVYAPQTGFDSAQDPKCINFSNIQPGIILDPNAETNWVVKLSIINNEACEGKTIQFRMRLVDINTMEPLDEKMVELNVVKR